MAMYFLSNLLKSKDLALDTFFAQIVVCRSFSFLVLQRSIFYITSCQFAKCRSINHSPTKRHLQILMR